MSKLSSLREDLLVFFISVFALALIILWLWSNQFVGDDSLRLWARTLTVFGQENIRVEYLGYMYPHGLFYALAPFYFLAPLGGPEAAYLVTALFAATLLMLWNKALRAAGHGAAFRCLLIVLVFAHPSFLWHASNGALGSISLLLFYFLYVSVLKVTRQHDIHSFILVGIVLAVFYFTSPLTLYLFVALIPLLALMVPRDILVRAPASAYVILAAPLMVVVSAWLYFNWVFYGSPLAFMYDPASGFIGGRQSVAGVSWLRDYGGRWLAPAGICLCLVFICYPIIFRLLRQIRRGQEHFRAALVLFLHPVMAAAMATMDYYLVHPMWLVSLVIAGVMAELTVYQPRDQGARKTAVLLLAAGLVGGWAVFHFKPTESMTQWSAALTGPVVPVNVQADRTLGKWLSEHGGETLVSDESAYQAIVAKGDSRGLILPFRNEFKVELRRRAPTVRQIAVPDPESTRGREDEINRRWPKLYEQGTAGYHLVYDYDGWRVWRKND